MSLLELRHIFLAAKTRQYGRRAELQGHHHYTVMIVVPESHHAVVSLRSQQLPHAQHSHPLHKFLQSMQLDHFKLSVPIPIMYKSTLIATAQSLPSIALVCSLTDTDRKSSNTCYGLGEILIRNSKKRYGILALLSRIASVSKACTPLEHGPHRVWPSG